MAVQHKWRVAIIMAHDGETYFEYNDLEQSILDQAGFENISYDIFYYNQQYQKFSIKKVFRGREKVYLEERIETSEYNCLDFYDHKTLIKFFQQFVIIEDDDKTVYHYMVLSIGHGGGLYYFPSGDIDKLINFLEIPESGNKKALIDKSLKAIRENISYYTFLKANTSSKGNQPDNQIDFPFLPSDLFKGDEFSGIDFKDKINQVNKIINEKVKLYTAFDLNEIFKEVLPKKDGETKQKKIELFFALNCYTQMLETGFELQETVEMMIASQTTMPLTGINYSELFYTLRTNPEIDQKILADSIKVGYENKYCDTNEPFISNFKTRYPGFPLSTVSFSSTFLSEYGNFVDQLNELTDFLSGIFYGSDVPNINAVQTARRNCEDVTVYENFGIIDLTNFLIQLEHSLPGELLGSLLKIKNRFDVSKLAALASIQKPVTVSRPGTPGKNPSFLSFFAPTSDFSTMVTALLKMYTSGDTKFRAASKWDDFVTYFHDKT